MDQATLVNLDIKRGSEFLDALDRATVLGPVRIGRALATPEFALIRGDPRVKALRRKVGLPE